MKKPGLIIANPNLLDLYIRIISERVNSKLGRPMNQSIDMIIVTIDYAEMMDLLSMNRWDDAEKIIEIEAEKLDSRVDYLAVCSNVFEKIVKTLKDRINTQILSITDALISYLKKKDIKNLGIIGSKCIIKYSPIYDELSKKTDLNLHFPNDQHFDMIDKLIKHKSYESNISEKDFEILYSIINEFINEGVECIINTSSSLNLGRNQINDVMILQSNEAHAEYIADRILND